MAFSLLSSAWFFAQTLAEKLSPEASDAMPEAPAWVSFAKLPYDVGVLYLIVLTSAWPTVFLGAYVALFVVTAAVAVLSMARKYRALARRRPGRRGTAGSDACPPALQRIRRRRSSTSARASASRELPAWPVLVLLWGMPAWWAFGLLPFYLLIMSVPMVAYLIQRGRVEIVPGTMPWVAFVVWMLPCALMLDSLGRVVGFGMRFSQFAGGRHRARLPRQRAAGR